MKKSLIALAVAGAFVAPSAMAEVTISGAINVGIAVINSKDSADGTVEGLNRTSLATNYSNVNIASVDDIGNGNKIILNLQMDWGAENTAIGGVANRNSYLGIAGDWGAFKMGTNENVYERFMYESSPLDGAMGIGSNIQMLGQSGLGTGFKWFDAGNGQAGSPSESGSFWRRTSHTIWYESPNWNGFTFEIDQTLSAYDDGVTNPTITSLGAQFKPAEAPWFANVAYEKHSESTMDLTGIGGGAAEIVDATGLQFGGGFKFGDIALTARYEMLEYEAESGGKLERNNIFVGLKWSLPSGYFGAEVVLADDADVDGGSLDSSGASMIGLGYYHNLSKQSQVYIVGTMIKNDDNANYGIGAGSGSTGGFGSDHTAATVGIKHTF